MAGRILALARRPGKDEPMETLDQLHLDSKSGVVEDYGTSPRRQVTIIAREAWESVLAELGAEHPWHTRRANVLVEGLELGSLIGKELDLGGCRVRVLGETVPCGLMDQLVPGLRRALEPECRGGVYGAIVRPGAIRPGDRVAAVEPLEQPKSATQGEN